MSAIEDSSAVDLNADVGEGCPHDAALMRVVTSVSIACGGHAGDRRTMRECVAMAVANDIAIGAHPGYPDRHGFGRRSIASAPEDVGRWTAEQVYALLAVCESAGARLRYVKPHGALYNRTITDRATAEALMHALEELRPRPWILTLPHGELRDAAFDAGFHVVAEAFLDRAYLADGTLMSRESPGAMISDPEIAAARALSLARGESISSADGSMLRIRAQSLCVHGDGHNPAEMARRARAKLEQASIRVQAFAP